MMNVYLELGEKNIIKNVLEVSYEVVSPNYVLYHEFDLELVGKQWNDLTGEIDEYLPAT